MRKMGTDNLDLLIFSHQLRGSYLLRSGCKEKSGHLRLAYLRAVFPLHQEEDNVQHTNAKCHVFTIQYSRGR